MNGTGNERSISAETVPEWTYFIQQASGEIKIGRSIHPLAADRPTPSIERGAQTLRDLRFHRKQAPVSDLSQLPNGDRA